MADIQPPPTYDLPIEVNPVTQEANFSPNWLKWFIDLAQIINQAGGVALSHNTLADLQGGTLDQYYHLTQSQHTGIGALGSLGTNRIVYSNASSALATEAGFEYNETTNLATLPNATVTAAGGNLAWGTYTPTLTNVANLDASTAYACQYLRLGNTVTVSGKVDVDPTAGAASTQLGISLPVASNIGVAEHCAGTAACPTIVSQSAAILGDAANNRAQMEWIAGDVTNQPMYFTFTYQII